MQEKVPIGAIFLGKGENGKVLRQFLGDRNRGSCSLRSRNLNKSYYARPVAYCVLRNELQPSPHIALSDVRATKSSVNVAGITRRGKGYIF